MEIVTNSRSRKGLQIAAMASANLVIIGGGIHYGWPSPSLPKLLDKDSPIPMTNEDGSWIAVMPLIGAVFGAIFGALVLDRIGRKKTILFTSIPFIVASLMVAYAKSVPVLMIARIFAGFGDGLSFCAVPMYLGEIASSSIRGLLGCSCSVTWILGTLLINVIGSHFDIRTAALISAVFPLLAIGTFSWMPESPYFLVMRGRIADARKCLQKFHGIENVEDDMLRMRNAFKDKSANFGKFSDLFVVKSNRKAVGIMMGLRGFQQLCGTSAITFYANTIFHNVGGAITPEQGSIIYFSIQVILCCVSSAIVDKTGRRPLLIISIIGSAIALLIEGIYFYLKNCTDISTVEVTFVPILALILFTIIFSIGFQCIPILMLGELFPTNVKAFALCLADIYFSIVATIVSKFFQIVKDSYGLHVPFFTFAGCALVGLIFVVLCVPETKGKTLEEIQQCLKGTSDTSDHEETDEKLQTFLNK